MTNWEKLVLEFAAAAAKEAITLTVHSTTSKAAIIWNASDDLFQGIVQTLTQPLPPPPGTP